MQTRLPIRTMKYLHQTHENKLSSSWSTPIKYTYRHTHIQTPIAFLGHVDKHTHIQTPHANKY